MKISSSYNLVERNVYHIEEYFGDIGGFLSILSLIGMILAQKMTEFLMHKEIFEKIYYIDQKKPQPPKIERKIVRGFKKQETLKKNQMSKLQTPFLKKIQNIILNRSSFVFQIDAVVK